ncbi:hypothetical protein Q0601_23765 [Paracoccus onubensis]|uniref:CdiA C-terminal domain-containing protein n=1 Tax=Paracoccus onubensis TaxID=1675788 RepID=UPI002730B4AA|nr:hypothetical protein [Paracoccus onubensis]MDP0930201.1 hypothetical protein [Paracoccus onubensis]
MDDVQISLIMLMQQRKDLYREKAKEQADNIVLNLADSPVDLKALSKQFSDWPIDGLNDLIVINPDGKIGGI